MKNGKATCKTCIDKGQQAIAEAALNKVKKIKLKTETEIVLKSTSLELNTQDEINKELNKLKARKNKNILALDLHDTIDLFKGDSESINKLASLKDSFAVVVIVSFVGKGNGSPDSMRSLARNDIQEFISQGVVDFGMLVFQRGPAKGWACHTLGKVFHKSILFSDDSDDHLESVQKACSAETYKSDPSTPEKLMSWIENNKN